jgi:hypothetical protein
VRGSLFDWYPVCPHPILVVCGLLPGAYNLTSDCHGDSKIANFSPPVCSPTGEAGKSYKAVFPVDLFSVYLRLATIVVRGEEWNFDLYSEDEILTYIVKVNFWKIVAFKGMIRKFLNMVAVHIEGMRHPLLVCLFDAPFSCQSPYKLIKTVL